MAGKKSAKALSREEGLERTDNGMKQTSWPDVSMINQKNYYTDYQKRDDQLLTIRLQTEANREKMIRNAKDKDRKLAMTGTSEVPLPQNGEEEDEDAADDGIDPTKIIVIHPGSQNLRIGFASDALPKTIPMTIASTFPITESEQHDARPRRVKQSRAAEQQFGEEFSKKYATMTQDLKVDMRVNKHKMLPSQRELVVNFNRKTVPIKVSEHNDPIRIEWTEVNKKPSDPTSYITGTAALRIPDDSKPKYKVFRPIQHGWLNENDYSTQESLLDDFEAIIEDALRNQLGLNHSSAWDEYSCVFVIPDLYDKRYVEEILRVLLTCIEFKQVTFIQESLAATYGAGYMLACVVDIGAQKTSICCVEDGMCVEDSRVNLKYGGSDVTEAFIKMMLHDHFPYADINLQRRYDFLLAEELKIQCCTLEQHSVGVKNPEFHLRRPNQPTLKYGFKTFDEIILAPMGLVEPSIFDNSRKLDGRRKLIDRSYNAYDVDIPDDPTSAAQLAILTSIKPSIASTTNGIHFHPNGNSNNDVSTPQKEKGNPLNLFRLDSEANGNSRGVSAAASPAPEGASTPVPAGPFVFGANGTNGGSPAPGAFQFGNGSHNGGTPNPPAGMFVDPSARTQKQLAIERDEVLPIAPLDSAIITSILEGVKGDEKRLRDYIGNIMVIGGGAKTPGLGAFIEERLKLKRPDLAERIIVGTSPREMDGQVVVWKGASVLGRMKTHESWVGQLEYERLGSRVLHHKMMWAY